MTNQKQTIKSFFQEHLSFIIYFVIMLLLTLLRIIVNFVGQTLSDNQLDFWYTVFAEFIIMGIVPVVLYIPLCKKGSFKDKLGDFSKSFGFNFKLPLSVYLLTLVIGVLIYHVTVFSSASFSIILTAIGYKRSIPAPTIYKNAGDLALGIFMTAFSPALCEELTHRGLIYSGLKKYGERNAVLISALLFALMHQNIMQVFYAFVAGIILGSLRSKTNSIIPGMIVHFSNNCIATVLEYSSQRNGAFYAFFSSIYNNTDAFSLILLVVSFFIVIYVFKMMINYMGAKCGNRIPIKLSRGRQLVIMKNPALAASLTLGLTTTLITLIWGFLR